jgi:hypothetical protein
MKHQTNLERAPSGFALVITLIMLALAAVITVGLLNTASTDRSSAKSISDRFQASLAIENGLEAAKRALTTDGNGNLTSRNDVFVITRVAPGPANPSAEDTTAHYYYLGQAQVGSANVIYYPLFSGGTPQTVATTAQPTFTAFDPSASTTAVNLPALLPDPAASPAQPLLPAVTTKWIDVVDPHAATGPKLRYCFWIEDLGGYIDANSAGNIFGKNAGGTADQTHTRDNSIIQPLIDAGTARPTNLIAMWTVLNPTSGDPAGTPQQADNQSIVSKRAALFTSETVKQAIVSSSAAAYLKKVSRHVVTGTRADSEQQVIPYGFSYPKEGTAKLDLNAKIGSKDVDGIASAIKDNLTSWASTRRGGFPYQALPDTAKAEDSYRRTIAANIIGYAQPIADLPIVGTDYRGQGAYPLVNEFYDYFDWKSSSDTGITVDITSWVELWNMSNQTISGEVKYTDYYRHRLPLGAYTFFDDNHDPEKPDPGEGVTGIPYPTQNVTMAPNELQLLKFGPATYTLTSGTIPPNTLPLLATSTGRYKLEWKSSSSATSVTVDQPLGGVRMERDDVYNPKNTSSQVPYKWNGTDSGFAYYAGVASFYDNPGDPRSAFYIAAPQASSDYTTSATLWSRNAKPTSTVPIRQEVKPSRWFDTGHDTNMISPIGLKDTVSPTTVPPANRPPIDSSKAPMFISGAGKLRSITELAQIYDPAQWKTTTSGNKWLDIDSASTADAHYGGGRNLRIGRREFTRFNVAGAKASELLDIFSAGARRETQGLVNLNTATRETLRALGAGLILDADPNIKAGTTTLPLTSPTNTDQGDKFADAVIMSRNSQPFIAVRQLADLQALDATGKPAKDASGNPIVFFGNPQLWDSAQPAPPNTTWEWNDTGTEEYFARIFDLASVRSRNFRLFVTGEYVDPRFPDASGNPKILSTAKKVYHVFLRPTRGSDGSISAQQVDVTYERDL